MPPKFIVYSVGLGVGALIFLGIGLIASSLKKLNSNERNEQLMHIYSFYTFFFL